MKKFIIQITAFSIVMIITFFGVLSMADGYTDDFYIRFTTKQQNNLIIGTSRAAQGIHPNVLNKKLDKIFFNYAFTGLHSPYGEVYYNSIIKKLDSTTKDGTFIISVTPWAIASRTTEANDAKNFREVGLQLDNTKNVNSYPNFDYLLNNLQGRFYQILANPFASSTFLRKDGLLEVNIPMDSISIEIRANKKIKAYREKDLKNYHFSELRLKFLKKLIIKLNTHGKVYLVRLPIKKEVLEIENELIPKFNKILLDEIIPLTSGYLDMSRNEFEKYIFTDGNHLSKESGIIVTEHIATWIERTN
tara:strand:+ start:4165 stop:5076 length:912 start_codon:yes stop_codon:yes gene_type:complete